MSPRTEQECLALAAVAEEVNACLAGGGVPDVEALAERHPQLAEDIRQLVPALAVLGQLSPTAVEAGGPPHVSPDALGQLGDFRIVREVGRGGMGVVYEAEQISLGRRVALKVLPFAAVLDPRHLRRFQAEAQAAARLHHTHIVPIYAVGTERGVHYYAMEFVEGRALSDVIAELRAWPDGVHRPDHGAEGPPPMEPSGDASISHLTPDGSTRAPSFFKSVARLGVQAAEALAHAHEMGVLHRDVKPSNLIVDAVGRIRVTDFGLARLAGDPSITMAGDILGTLRYMSPEQASAGRAPVDHHTDVYSLGATLYELLALRPALDGRDRRELLRKIAEEEPPSLRRTNPVVPEELETVVRKAMAKDPEDRYETAGALAADLRRFLEDVPVRARRPTLARRGVKWMRRHQAAVTSGIVVLAVAVAALAAGTALVWRAKLETEAALVTAERNRREARANFERAFEAVDRMLTRVSEGPLVAVPGMTLLRRQLLEEALRFHLGFLAENDDPRVRLETARAYRRVAGIHQALGRNEEAGRAHREAVRLLERLDGANPDDARIRGELAAGLNGIGLHHTTTGDYPEAARAFLRARSLLDGLVAASAEDFEDRRRLARNHIWYANLLGCMGKVEERVREHERATAILAPLVAATNDVRDRFQLASNELNLGGVLGDLGRLDESIAAYDRARERFEALAPEIPGDLAVKESIALAYHNLGVRYRATARTDESGAAFTRAVELYTELRQDFPARVETRFERARAVNGLAAHLQQQGRRADAERRYDEACREMESVLERAPDVPAYQNLLAEILQDRASLAFESGSFEAAEKPIRREIGIREALVAAVPASPLYREKLALARVRLGVILTRRGRLEAAVESERRAIEEYGRVGEESKLTPWGRRNLAEAWNAIGLVRHTQQRFPEAETCFRRALGVHERLQEEHPDAERYRPHRALVWSNLGSALQEQDRYADAIAACEKAVRLVPAHLNARANLAYCLAAAPDAKDRDPARALELTEGVIRESPKLASAWNTYCIALFRCGRHRRAIRAIDRTADLEGGQTVYRLYLLALARHELGDRTRALESFEEAETHRHLEPADDAALEAIRREAAAALGRPPLPPERRGQ